MTNEQRRWIQAARTFGGSFVKAFAEACICADDSNFAILQPVLVVMMDKYDHYNHPPYQPAVLHP